MPDRAYSTGRGHFLGVFHRWVGLTRASDPPLFLLWSQAFVVLLRERYGTILLRSGKLQCANQVAS